MENDRLNILFKKIIAIVDSCIEDNDFDSYLINHKIRLMLYISFTGFLIYYGPKNLNIIYNSFKKTKLYLFPQTKETTNINTFPAFVKTSYRKNNGVLELDDCIYMFNSEELYTKTGLNFLIHEFNHIINSNYNRIINNNIIRSGICLYNISNKQYKNKAINEAFNTLQTKEIENIVINFSKNNLMTKPYWDDLKQIITKISIIYNDYEPYPLTTKIINDLYNDKKFKEIYKENSLNGKIFKIINSFDNNIYKEGFNELSELIELCNNNTSVYEQQETVNKAKNLVKKYLNKKGESM